MATRAIPIFPTITINISGNFQKLSLPVFNKPQIYTTYLSSQRTHLDALGRVAIVGIAFDGFDVAVVDAGDEAGMATPVATGDDEDDSGFEQGGVVHGFFLILILGSAPIYFR